MRIGERLSRLEAQHPDPVRHWDFSRTSDEDLAFVSQAGRQYRDMAAMPVEIAARFVRILGETSHAHR